MGDHSSIPVGFVEQGGEQFWNEQESRLTYRSPSGVWVLVRLVLMCAQEHEVKRTVQ